MSIDPNEPRETDILGLNSPKEVPGIFMSTSPLVISQQRHNYILSQTNVAGSEIEKKFQDLCAELRKHVERITGKTVEIEDLKFSVIETRAIVK